MPTFVITGNAQFLLCNENKNVFFSHLSLQNFGHGYSGGCGPRVRYSCVTSTSIFPSVQPWNARIAFDFLLSPQPPPTFKRLASPAESTSGIPSLSKIVALPEGRRVTCADYRACFPVICAFNLSLPSRLSKLLVRLIFTLVFSPSSETLPTKLSSDPYP